MTEVKRLSLIHIFEELIDAQKEKRGVKNDTDLTTDDLKELVQNFKAAVKKQTGEDFPACPWDQPVSYTHLDVYKRQALRCDGQITIENAECGAKSYPGFFEDLEKIRV